MAHEGGNYAHRGLSVFLRLGELACAVIVLGILARFCYLISIVQVKADGRVVYTLVIAGISIIYAIVFAVPFNVLFMSFPFDFILFVCWIVAFALLVDKSPRCSNAWFNDYWGYYWGRFYRFGPVGTVGVRNTGCAYWRTALAFSFIAAMGFLMSFILGIYVFRTYVNVKDSVATAKQQAEKLKRPRDQQVNGAQHTKRSATPPSPVVDRPPAVAQTAEPNVQRPVEQQV